MPRNSHEFDSQNMQDERDSSQGDMTVLNYDEPTGDDVERTVSTPAEEEEAGDLSESARRYYPWIKCACDPAEHFGRDHYFLNKDTRESTWEDPGEPYWLWDAEKQGYNEVGLQRPTSRGKAVEEKTEKPKEEKKEEYWGYNPKIHGDYDPNAPYAAYHDRKRAEEAAAEAAAKGRPVDGAIGQPFEFAATFNRFTGAFQTADKSADRHSDANKSHRQMSAFFDVEAAANSHDGRSLKAERQQIKYSKKEMQEMVAKRKEKKLKKRLDFYRS